MSLEQDEGTISKEETTVKTVNIAVYTTQAFQKMEQANLIYHQGKLMIEMVKEELIKDPTLSKYLPTEIIDRLIIFDSEFEVYKRD